MGSSSASPELSGKERKLVKTQTGLLDQAQNIITGAHGNFQAAMPELFRLAGYEVQQNPNQDKLNTRADARQKRLDEWTAGQSHLGDANKQYIADENAAIARLREKAGKIRGVTPTGPESLTLADVPEGDMPLLRHLTNQSFNTLTKNLKTFDPNRPDPFVEEQLKRAREAETERMMSRMGPGADVSSAGMESLRNLDLNEILARDAARRQNYDMQLRQFDTLGTLGLRSSGETFNRRAALRGEQNQNTLTQEGFRQQRLSELGSLLQMPMSFAGPLGSTASGFNSPLAAYAGARQPPGPSAGQTLAGVGGGALAGAATGAMIPGGFGVPAGAAIGGLAGLFGGM